MPPRNASGLSGDQKRAAVDEALRLMRAGMSQSKAAALAGGTVGVAATTVRRWAESDGRPLAQATDANLVAATEKARRVARALSVDDYAQALNEFGTATLEEIHERFVRGDRDPREFGRLGVNLKRAIEMDARLAAAGASPQPVPEETQGDAPSVEEQRLALTLLEDWRRNREQREGPRTPEVEAQP